MRHAIVILALSGAAAALSACSSGPAAQTAAVPPSPVEAVGQEVKAASDRQKYCTGTGTRLSRNCTDAKVGDEDAAREYLNRPIINTEKGN